MIWREQRETAIGYFPLMAAALLCSAPYQHRPREDRNRRISVITTILSVLIAVFFVEASPAMLQLPPEILSDLHLLRSEQAIREDDLVRARAEIDKILLLQKNHQLDLSGELHFRLAKVAAAAGLPEQTFNSVEKYLLAAGQEGQHYVEALELMNQAQDAIAARKEAPVQASSQIPIGAQSGLGGTPGVQTEPRDLPNTVETTAAPRAPECDLSAWNTKEYFKTATDQDVKACIEAGANPNARNDSEDTPLHWAARYNDNPGVIEALLAASADPNARQNYKITPLHLAAGHNGNPAVIQVLLAAGADLTARDYLKQTPLHWAAEQNGNPGVIEALLAAGADLTAQDGSKSTPLHLSARGNGNPAIARVLLNAGGGSELKWTPLHKAAWHTDDTAAIKALLDAGADPNARDRKKTTPLHLAARTTGNGGVIHALLNAGADPNAKADGAWRPLHWAARHNENPAVIEALLAAGADSNARGSRSHWKSRPLHWAAGNNKNPAVIEALLAAGADPNVRAHLNQTPLHWAGRNKKNPEAAQALLAAGADPNARTSWGKETPLHWAVQNENLVVVQALLAAGADLNAQDNDKETSLHWAASQNENPSVIQALLKAGADMAVQNEQGHTPLYLSRNNTNSAMMQELLAAGAEEVERQLATTRVRKKPKQGSGWGGLGALMVGAAVGVAAGSGASADDVLGAGVAVAESMMTDQPSAGGTGAVAVSGQCEIPGYPRPADVQNLGLSWCPATVGFQARVFALQAAGAQCAIATGSSSTPEQIQARRQEIQTVCAQLAALGVPNCRCPSSGVVDEPGYSEASSSIDREKKRREQQAKQQEEARQAAQREQRRIEATKAEVLNSNCSCISIRDNGEYVCMDGFVQGPDATKPLCDIRR